VLVRSATRQITEVRFNQGYTGRLANGLGLCSTLTEVLARSGGALKRVRAPRSDVWSHGMDRVLYEVTYEGNLGSYLFRDSCRGILYWFAPDHRATQIVVHPRYQPRSGPGCAAP
jgi:hypothetical protein